MASSDSSSIYTFGGRIYAGNVEVLRPKLESHFEEDTTGCIVLDVTRVTMCDSYGLRLLINLKRMADTSGKSLVLYRPGRILRDVLDNTRLSHVFTIVDTPA